MMRIILSERPARMSWIWRSFSFLHANPSAETGYISLISFGSKILRFNVIFIVFSIICGILSKDYFIGTLILICGLLNSYYASLGKIENYIFGGLYSILVGYVSYINGLYGLASLSILVYVPSQIHGYFSWKKNMNFFRKMYWEGEKIIHLEKKTQMF